jgi:hypothetical protein
VTALADLLALRDVTRGELENQADASVTEDVGYEGLEGVDRIHAPSFSPAHFFFAGPELKLVYVPRTAVGGQDAQPWLDELGSGPQLRSRTGKRGVLEVRPERGFAFSHQDDQVELAEVFPPTTLEAYERDIYEEPAPGIR